MPISPADFDYVRDLVRRRSAIVLEKGKEYLVESRLQTLARKESMECAEALIAALRHDATGRLAERVVEAMTTNETSFFRDQHPFEALKTVIIPELIKNRKAERKLNVWSAACSTGQEACSIAMTLRAGFPDLAGWSIKIMATDLSSDMVARCRSGRFSQLEISRGLPAPMMVRFFRRDGADWVLNSDLLAMFDCREFNLMNDFVGVPSMDVVFLRNVLIYFDAATKSKILARVRRVLRPDGFLILGSSETIFENEGFETTTVGRTPVFRPRTLVNA